MAVAFGVASTSFDSVVGTPVGAGPARVVCIVTCFGPANDTLIEDDSVVINCDVTCFGSAEGTFVGAGFVMVAFICASVF
jgi:hypothetical protein